MTKGSESPQSNVRRLIARYLAVPDAMPVGVNMPGNVEQLLDDLHRQRTLQGPFQLDWGTPPIRNTRFSHRVRSSR